ncbi:MAG: hypothetical protein FJ360_00805 [Thaumarchaeota archaeon]|nr:hypothetical protein [Nitrososphaerota archaeon]MBM3896277.1 hypothetical protein [Nitrososphaerota archaeon]
MIQTLKLVFSNHKYFALAVVISVGLFFPLSIISEYIFLKPYLVMNIPSDRAFGFSLIVAVSVLSGIVIAMNVYRIKTLHNQARKMGGGLFGSIIGASAGACSCGPIGFAIISTFGTTAGIATAFLSNYEIPLRLVALAILGFTYYTTTKSLSVECKIKS